jgi:hypothetical protein
MGVTILFERDCERISDSEDPITKPIQSRFAGLGLGDRGIKQGILDSASSAE